MKHHPNLGEEASEGLPFLIKVSLIGIFGGFLGGLLGIGGSFLVIPFLSGLLGLSSHKAHATALPVAFASGLSALGFYSASGHIDLKLTIPVMISSLVGVLLGTRWMKYVKGRHLSLWFGCFLLIIAAGFALSLTTGSEGQTGEASYSLLRSILLGLAAGIPSGLFGAGGGIIMVPGAVLLLQVAEQTAQGISLLAIVPTTLLGTWMQYRQGNIASKVAPYLTATAFLGGLLGGWLAVHLHGSVLKGLLIVILLYIGIQNVWKNRPRKNTRVKEREL